MDRISTKDGTQIYYKDWGAGRPVVFSHGWPLSADAWDARMMFLGQHGYRVIAHDRRGHGRSGQPWESDEMETHADDPAALNATLKIYPDLPHGCAPTHADQINADLLELVNAAAPRRMTARFWHNDFVITVA